jgi:hypothetical protein
VAASTETGLLNEQAWKMVFASTGLGSCDDSTPAVCTVVRPASVTATEQPGTRFSAMSDRRSIAWMIDVRDRDTVVVLRGEGHADARYLVI